MCLPPHWLLPQFEGMRVGIRLLLVMVRHKTGGHCFVVLCVRPLLINTNALHWAWALCLCDSTSGNVQSNHAEFILSKERRARYHLVAVWFTQIVVSVSMLVVSAALLPAACFVLRVFHDPFHLLSAFQ